MALTFVAPDDALAFEGYPQPADVPPDPSGQNWRGIPGPPGEIGPLGPPGPPGPMGIYVSETPPPLIADATWFDPNSGQAYVALDDGDSVQWVPLASNIARGGIFIGDDAPDPSTETAWFDTTGLELYISYFDGDAFIWVPASALVGGLPLNGGTLTGDLILDADPSLDLGAATKHYVDTHSGSGLTAIAAANLLANSGTASAVPAATPIGGGLSFNAGTLTSPSGTMTSLIAGTGLAGGTITNAGTVSLATRAAASLMGNPGTAAAVPSDITIGAGVSLSTAGTLSATGSGGTVTGVTAGTGLSGGSITNAGTIALANRTASTLMGNPGTAAATPSDITLGANLALSTGGVLSATDTNTNIWNAGTVISVGTGLALSGGTLTGTVTDTNIWNAGTVTKLGANLTLSAGTLTATDTDTNIWNAGTVTTISTGLTLTSGTLTASASGGVPVITTLLSPNPASGNLTANGTEQTIASSTSLSVGAIFQPLVDLTNMADGDLVIIKTYRQVNGSSSLVEESAVSFSNAQSDLIPELKLTRCTVGLGYKATVQQTAGTNRTFQWSVQNEAGT